MACLIAICLALGWMAAITGAVEVKPEDVKDTSPDSIYVEGRIFDPSNLDSSNSTLSYNGTGSANTNGTDDSNNRFTKRQQDIEYKDVKYGRCLGFDSEGFHQKQYAEFLEQILDPKMKCKDNRCTFVGPDPGSNLCDTAKEACLVIETNLWAPSEFCKGKNETVSNKEAEKDQKIEPAKNVTS